MIWRKQWVPPKNVTVMIINNNGDEDLVVSSLSSIDVIPELFFVFVCLRKIFFFIVVVHRSAVPLRCTVRSVAVLVGAL